MVPKRTFVTYSLARHGSIINYLSSMIKYILYTYCRIQLCTFIILYVCKSCLFISYEDNTFVRKYLFPKVITHTVHVGVRKYFRTFVLSYESTKVLSKVRRYLRTSVHTHASSTILLLLPYSPPRELYATGKEMSDC